MKGGGECGRVDVELEVFINALDGPARAHRHGCALVHAAAGLLVDASGQRVVARVARRAGDARPVDVVNVDVADLVKAMMLLMESTISAERFIISAENLSYREVFNQIALNFQKKPPHKKVTKLIAAIVWRIEALKGYFTGKAPLLTKETAATAQAHVQFNNSKLLQQFPAFQYRPIAESIERICKELIKKHNL